MCRHIPNQNAFAFSRPVWNTSAKSDTTAAATPESRDSESVEQSGESREHLNRMENEKSPSKFINVVNNLRVKHPREQQKGPKLIDPPELDLSPKGKRWERARRQHNAVKPYREEIQ